MLSILSNIKIQINPNLFVKDPETSDLGKKIIKESILLIDEIGLENFTFKKLGQKIESNESSIYRYFENKQKLVMYLSAWYWSWIECKLVFSTTNIGDANEKLEKAIAIVTEKITDDIDTDHINEGILNKIIISEFSKAIYTKEVDENNKEGYFLPYKRVINRIVSLIEEVKPDYPFAKSLASTIVEGGLHQHFLTHHLKTITNCEKDTTVTGFYVDLVRRVIN